MRKQHNKKHQCYSCMYEFWNRRVEVHSWREKKEVGHSQYWRFWSTKPRHTQRLKQSHQKWGDKVNRAREWVAGAVGPSPAQAPCLTRQRGKIRQIRRNRVCWALWCYGSALRAFHRSSWASLFLFILFQQPFTILTSILFLGKGSPCLQSVLNTRNYQYTNLTLLIYSRNHTVWDSLLAWTMGGGV